MNRILKKLIIILFALVAVTCIGVAAGCKDGDKKTNAVSVTLVSEDGVASAPALLLPGDPLPVVTVENMQFEGYWTDSAYTQRYNETVVPATDITLYYKLIPQSYAVIIDYGPLGTVDLGTVELGQSVTLPGRELSGKELAGFALRTGAEAVYMADTPVKDLAKSGETVTLYAVWTSPSDEDFEVRDGVVIAYNGSDAEITLPSTASVVDADAFKNSSARRKITSVTVPDCYTAIERGAFESLTNLEKLTVPFIGGSRYSNRFLAYVFGAKEYKDNVYSFSLYADESGNTIVDSQQDFSSLYIPKSLRTVRVTGEIRDIAEGAFYYAYGLENLIIDHPENLRRIGDSAFEACYYFGMDGEIGTAVCPVWLEYVSYIGDSAFKSYTGNTENAVKTINYEGTLLQLIDYDAPLNNLTYIPKLNNVVEIGDDAFYYCAMLNELEFGNKLRSIGLQAFMFTITLTHVSFPESLVTIGDFAFNASGVSTVEFAGNVRSIGTMAFAQCSSLNEVIFNGDSVPTLVGGQCFNNNVEEAATESWNLVFIDGFRISVKDTLLSDFANASDWNEYDAYLDPVKTEGSTLDVGYMSLYGNGWDVKFEFTEGGTVYVTDPDFAFISGLDYYDGQYADSVGVTYPLRYEVLSQEEYGEVLENNGFESRPVYANQQVIRLWHPLVTYNGNVINSYIMVTMLPYSSENGTVLVPEVSPVDAYNAGEYGSSDEGTFFISQNMFGSFDVYKITDGQRVEQPAPQGTHYASMAGNSTATGITIIYYDKDFNVLSRREFMRDDVSGTDAEAPIYELAENQQVVLTGNMYNDAQLFLKGSAADIVIGGKQYSAAAAAVAGKSYGEEGYTVNFTDVKSDGSEAGITGKAVFSDFDGEIYARVDLTVGGESSMILNTVSYADWQTRFYNRLASDPAPALPDYNEWAEDWRYASLSATEVLGSVNFYTYNGKTYFRQLAADGKVTAYGTATLTDAGAALNGADGTVNASFDEGNLVIDGVTYTYYDYLTDMTTKYTVQSGWFDVTWYYTIKSDGYGNMLIILENYSEYYDDPLYYFGSYVSGDAPEVEGYDYGALVFTGTQVDASTGKPVSGAVTETSRIVYDNSSRSYRGTEGDAPWVSDYVGMYGDADTEIEVVDEDGFKVFEVTIDAYGFSSHRQFAYTFGEDGEPVYAEVQSDVAYFTADPNGSGAYVAVGSDGMAKYVITPVQTDESSAKQLFRLERADGLMVSYGDIDVSPDAALLESVSAGTVFGSV